MNKDSGAGVVIFLGLLTLGTTQLFFGYVETYPPLIAGMLLYIFLAVRQLDNEGSVFWPAVVFLLCVLMHLLAFSLVPSLAYLYLQWWKSPRRKSKPASLVIVSLGPITVVTLFMLLIGLNPGAIFTTSEGTELPFFPFVQESSIKFNYNLFSFRHLIDLSNLILLVSPFCIPLCLFLAVCRRSMNGASRFLILASVFPLGFLALFNPALGFPRDWDVFAFSLIAPTLLGILALIEIAGKNKDLLSWSATAIIGVGLLHVLPWILVQADENRSLERYEHLLAGGTMHSKSAKALGHEDLAVFYRDKGRLELAEGHYRKAVEVTPEVARLYVSLAGVYYIGNNLDKAISALENAVKKSPESYQLHSALAWYLRKKGDLAGAVSHYKEAVNINPDLYLSWYNLGSLANETGMYGEAVGYFEKAIELQPDFIRAHLSIGNTYFQLGLLDKAVREYNTVLDLDPDNKLARNNLKAVKAINQEQPATVDH